MCNFDVQILVNKKSHEVDQAIETFFNGRTRDDLLLLYFSGHGLKDEDGKLYFATPDTNRMTLRTTSISASLVNDLMRSSRSRRQVLLLDCCYSGAFAKGMIAKSGAVGTSIRTNDYFQGRGRVVLTASDAMQYAFEEDELVEEGAVNSIFTSAIVDGIESWKADNDRDGRISITELYDYVDSYVYERTPNQRPSMWSFETQGEIFIAEREDIPRAVGEETQERVPEARDASVDLEPPVRPVRVFPLKQSIALLVVISSIIGIGYWQGMIPFPSEVEVEVPGDHVFNEIRIGIIAASEENSESLRAVVEDIIEPDVIEYLDWRGYNVSVDFHFDFFSEGSSAGALEKMQTFNEMGINLIVWLDDLEPYDIVLFYANENDMLLISDDSTDQSFAVKDDMLFRAIPNDYAQALIISQMWSTWGIEAVLTIHGADEKDEGLWNISAKEFSTLGILDLGRIEYPEGVTDFSSYLDDANDIIASSASIYGADKVGIQFFGSRAWRGSNEYRTIQSQVVDYPNLMDVIWMTTEDGYYIQFYDEAGEWNPQTRYFSPTPTVDWYNDEYQEFNQKYEDIYGDSGGFHSTLLYDACMLLVNCIIEIDGTEPSDIAEVIIPFSQDYEGIGGWMSLDENGDRQPQLYNIVGFYQDPDSGEYLSGHFGLFDGHRGDVQWDDEALESFTEITQPGESVSGASISGLVHLSLEPWDGVKVDLCDSDGNVLESTTTSDGIYTFSSLIPGSYVVRAYVPDSDTYDWEPVEVTEDIFTYTVDIELPVLFDLSLPADGSTIMDLKPSLYWEPVEYAVEYHGEVYVESTDELVVSFITEVPKYTFIQDLTPGLEYHWMVYAVDEDDYWVGDNRNDLHFTISSDATDDAQPVEGTLPSGWSITDPVLDGVINVVEWYDAYPENITLTYYSGQIISLDQRKKNATIYCKNDDESLFIALKIYDVPYIETFSVVDFFFDENNNGIIDAIEDFLWCTYHVYSPDMYPDLYDQAILNNGTHISDSEDIDLGGTVDVFGSFNHSNPTLDETGTLCLEIAHLLDSNDDYDASLAPGSLVGFGINYYIEAGSIYYSWPTGVRKDAGWDRMITLEITSNP